MMRDARHDLSLGEADLSQGVWDHDGMLPGAGVEVHTAGQVNERSAGSQLEGDRRGQGEEDGLGCRRRCTDGR